MDHKPNVAVITLFYMETKHENYAFHDSINQIIGGEARNLEKNWNRLDFIEERNWISGREPTNCFLYIQGTWQSGKSDFERDFPLAPLEQPFKLLVRMLVD